MTSAFGPSAVWAGLDHLPLPDAVDFVRRVEAAGYHAFWTREGFGRDPFVVLALAAGVTERITLGTSIANVHARDAAAMRAAGATLQEVTGGRFALGLGVSHAPWVEGIRGHDYGSPLEVMRGYLDAYASAPYRGPVAVAAPPILIAALQPRMVELASTASDGVFPYLVPSTSVASYRDAADRAAAAAGHRRPDLIVAQGVLPIADADAARAAAATWIKVYLGLPAYVANLRRLGFEDADLLGEPSVRLIDALVAWGSPATIRGRLRRMLEDGADQVAVVPLRPDGIVGDADAFEAVAPPW